MKVKCINNDEWEGCLTIGKIYEVLGEIRLTADCEEFTIKDDLGEEFSFNKIRFELTDE